MAPRDVHPLAPAVALAAIHLSLRTGRDLFASLTEQARRLGVASDSEGFDDAAELIGVPYCRALDLYVDRSTRDRAEALHFTEAHMALA
jgi:hypothetical protein